MKKSMFLMAIAAISLASCSNNEVLDEQKNAVNFNVSTGNTSRGTVTKTSSITGFNVWGWAKASNEASATVFMNKVSVTGNNTNGWSYSPTQFWPNSGSVDFYSLSPSSVTPTTSTTGSPLTVQHTVDTDLTKQIDLLYAVNIGESKKTVAVNVNFRHALAQLAFKAYVDNQATNITVKVKGVKIYNIKNSATLTLPTQTTTPWLDTDNDTDAADATWGTWASYTTDLVNYEADFSSDTEVTLSTSSENLAELTDSENVLLVLPQGSEEANGAVKAATESNGKLDLTSGAYATISCNITQGNTQLWPATAGEYAEVAIPLQPDWKQGYKYIYTFVFGKGAGYDGTTANNTAADPVLYPVSFTVSVDEFQTTTVSPNISMETTNTTNSGN